MRGIMRIAAIIFFTYLLAACSQIGPNNYESSTQMARQNTPAQLKLIQYVRSQGVGVVRMGDELKIVLPSDQFFEPDSTNRKATQNNVLSYIAELIRSYPKIDVTIAGYTDCNCPPNEGVAVSREQAQIIAKYLWRFGIDTRLLYAEGFGGLNPIDSNLTMMGREENRRIEIVLKKPPSEKVVS